MSRHILVVGGTGMLSELVEALAAPAAPYPAFQAAFCPWDDGRAGDRVVDRLLR